MPSAKEIAGGLVNSATSTFNGAVQGFQSRNATDAGEVVSVFRKSQDMFTVGPEVTKAVNGLLKRARSHAQTKTSGVDQKAVFAILDEAAKKVQQIVEKATQPVVETIRDKSTRMQHHLN